MGGGGAVGCCLLGCTVRVDVQYSTVPMLLLGDVPDLGGPRDTTSRRAAKICEKSTTVQAHQEPGVRDWDGHGHGTAHV